MMRAFVTAAALLTAVPAMAAEIKVISAGAVRGIVGDMIADYTRQTGHTFKFTTGPTGMLRDAIASGQPADLIIASDELMAELEKTGKMTPGSRVDLGRLGLGVVVRADAPAPDLSTPDALKAALLKASTIAHTDPKLGGVSVKHLMKIAQGFGIADEVTKKGVFATGGNDAVAKVAQGKAELAVVLISEIHDKGARLAAPLPEPLQLYTVYSAAIPANSSAPAEARAFVAALSGPALRQRWLDAGFQPLGK